jgi:hypothetical protein
MGLRNERHRAKTLPVRQQAGHLSAEQRQSLEGDGYLLVPSLLDETVLGPIASRLEQLVCQTVAVWDADPGRATAEQVERGVVRLQLDRADLTSRRAASIRCCRTRPRRCSGTSGIWPR